jgi:hypothetical protein
MSWRLFWATETGSTPRRTFIFDPSAIPRLRMIGRLRQSLGINLAGIAVVQELHNKVCELQRENELLRIQF